MFYEIRLGLRYFKSKTNNTFISFISLVSILGMALGITALITVLSVMNGFQNELKTRILSLAAQVTIYSKDEPLQNLDKIYKGINAIEDIKSYAPNINEQVMLSLNGKVEGSLIKGIDTKQEVKISEIKDKIIAGSFDALETNEFGIILGKELAVKMQAKVGDKITLIAPSSNLSILGSLPVIKRFTVVGVFEAGIEQYDSIYSYTNLNSLAKVFNYPQDSIFSIELKVADVFEIDKIKQELTSNIDSEYLNGVYISDWRIQNENFLRAISLEKKIMFIVLSLIILIAVFNIVTTMTMVVTDKQASIAILSTLGAKPRSIRRIFITQGLIIGFIGIALGVVGGISVALNIESIISFFETLLGFKIFPSDVYYISDFPSDIELSDIAIVTISSFILNLLATLYPAYQGTKINPSVILSHN